MHGFLLEYSLNFWLEMCLSDLACPLSGSQSKLLLGGDDEHLKVTHLEPNAKKALPLPGIRVQQQLPPAYPSFPR